MSGVVANSTLAVTGGTNAYIVPKSIRTVDLGTHMMFIGEVTEMKTLSDVPSAAYCYYQEHTKARSLSQHLTMPGTAIPCGAARCVATNMSATSCPTVSSVRHLQASGI